MSYNGNEIVTFQFGHYSNYIGTHWWNCQEAGFEYTPDTPSEVNHDVLFREGQTSRGEVTFTPRLLLVDLKGSLGVLPESGRLYNTVPNPDPSLPLWPADKVTVQRKRNEPKNEFLQDLEQGEASATTLLEGLKKKGQALPKIYHLDDSVKSWPDFLRPHLHPRSVNVVQEYQHNDSSQPFNTFSQGQAVWSGARFNEEFTDCIRLYLEETDNLQGFQVLLDSFDGFSGLSCGALQYLHDEYPSKSALCLASQPPQNDHLSKNQISVNVLNQALTFSSLAELSSMFVPVSGSTQAWRNLGNPIHMPHVKYKPDQYYHTSSLVASAVDTLSLVYRLRSSPLRLADLTSRFSMWGRLAAALSVTLPFPLHPSTTVLDTLEGWEGPLTHSLTPQTDMATGQWIQDYVLRGIPESRLMRTDQQNLSSSNPAYNCRSLAQLLKTFLQFDSQTTALSHVTTADCPFKTSAPFPHIFDQFTSSNGEIDSVQRPQYLGVDHVAVLAGLHSCQSLGPLLESLHTEAKKVDIRSFHQFTTSGLESTDLGESLEQLLCLSECYSDNQMDLL